MCKFIELFSKRFYIFCCKCSVCLIYLKNFEEFVVTMTSCACCVACKPRYKRLVDNIFPSPLENGLVRSEMEKLTYYAVSAPEKLDRIGVYLAKLLTRNIQRRKDAAVFIAMEALNRLLLACHAQQINLFVESFLKMVATLLESENPEFQALGTNSFERFSKIEEDTPSYHRRYDFFVSKFSSMCHSNNSDKSSQQKIQLHGVRGLRGVIRKTVSDELQVNIWEKQHMDKIVPSLLYTMQNNPNKHLSEDGSPVAADDGEYPWVLAEDSFRELLSRAAFANVSAAIFPVLNHMDNHKLWSPDNSFAIKCFKIIMYSIQGQYTHVTVKMLLDHIDAHTNENESIKASMLKVLCAIVPIPSSTAIGPAVIDVFNRLAKHLKFLANSKGQEEFENALIEATGVLASAVPDYQKLEIILFYGNKAHEALSGGGSLEEITRGAVRYSHLLLQCLHRISSTFKESISLSSLTSSLLDPLLKVSLLADPNERLLAQQVLVTLLDKNGNINKLFITNKLSDLIQSDLISSAPSKSDADFIDRRLQSIYRWLFECFVLDDNCAENYVFLYKCIATICLSITCPDVVMELSRLTLAVQSTIVDWLNTGTGHNDVNSKVSYGMAATASNMLLLSHVSSVVQFERYVENILSKREEIFPMFLPSALLETASSSFHLQSDVLAKVLFTSSNIYDALVDSRGFNVEKLNQPFLANLPLDSLSSDIQRKSIDVESINIQFRTATETSTDVVDGLLPYQAITFAHLKQVATQTPLTRADQLKSNKQVADHVLSAPFEQLLAEMKPYPVMRMHKLVEQLLLNENYSDPDDEGIDETNIPMHCLT